jgi:hypothetical protein
VPDIGRNKWNTPLVSEAFMKAQEMAKYKVLAWLNADILVNEAWAKAVLACAKKFPQFLAVGQRWDTPSLDKPLNFGGNWWKQALNEVNRTGKLHSPGGIDNFAFTRGLYKEMPPFAVGKSSWDNWLVADPMNKRYPIVNITEACTIIHQGAQKGKVVTEERKANRRLAGQKLATIKNASWLMGPGLELRLPTKTKARAKGKPAPPKKQIPSEIKLKKGRTGILKVISLQPLVVQWTFVNPLGTTMKPKQNYIGYEIRFPSGRIIQKRRTVTSVQKELKPGAGVAIDITPTIDWPPGEYEIWFDFLHGNKWGQKMGFVPLKMLAKITPTGQISVRM